MPRGLTVGLALGGTLVGLPVLAAIVLFLGAPISHSSNAGREIRLPNQGTLVIGGETRSRSEHGFSEQVGYRAHGSDEIEWFGAVSDGAEPQVYDCGSLLVIIDLPSACLFVRNPESAAKWKNFALMFPNDLGPFPVSFYAKKSGLTSKEVLRIDGLGGKRDRKYPTTYIESFDPVTRDLRCSYHVDNKDSWPLQLRLLEDGAHLRLVAIGDQSR